MNYQINEIVFENIKEHHIFCHKTNMLFSLEGSGCEIRLSDFNQETAIFILRFYGDVCEWETDNNNYIIKSIPGFELVNNNICAAENKAEWLALLN